MRTVVVAIVANAGIAVAKGIVAALTGSAAMFAETVHSIVDTVNEGLLLLGERRSSKPPDERHPFGYGHELYFWSLVVSIVVFGVGGGMGIVEGVERVLHPEALGNPTWSYAVLAIATVLEGVSWVTAFNAQRKTARDWSPAAILRSIAASKDPRVFIVLVEDSAALAGLATAFIGTFVAHVTGEPRYDGASSIVIGLVLALVAIGLVRETRGLLIGESATPETVAAIRAAAERDPNVLGVKRLLTMHLAPDNVLVNADLDLVRGLGAPEIDATIERFEAAARAIRTDLRMLIFVEVDSHPHRIAKPASRSHADG